MRVPARCSVGLRRKDDTVSDVSQGEGWWQASDGKWYPPEQAPPGATSGTPQAGAAQESSAPVSSESPTQGPETAAAAPTTPPGGEGPPAGAQQAPAGGGGKGKLIVALVAVIALVAGGFVLISVLDDDEASAESVLLEPIGDAGPNPFSTAIAPEPGTSLRQFAASLPDQLDEDGTPDAVDPDDEATDDDDETADDETTGDAGTTGDRSAGEYRRLRGGVPGLYGGTLDETSCDPDQLVGFLEAEEDKAAAFADVLKIDVADIEPYIDGLTPVNLGADTRVINHGFADGAATPRESVLQRGSAVLVDAGACPGELLLRQPAGRCETVVATPSPTRRRVGDFDAAEVGAGGRGRPTSDALSWSTSKPASCSTGTGSRIDRDGGSRPATSEPWWTGPSSSTPSTRTRWRTTAPRPATPSTPPTAPS
jgi:hypothetical protein